MKKIFYDYRFFTEKSPIIEWETSYYRLYLGYIAPDRNLIDFNNPFRESEHDGWDNIVLTTFLRFVSYIIKGTSIKDLKANQNNKYIEEIIESLKYPGLKEYVIRDIRFYLNENKEEVDVFLKELDNINTYNVFKWGICEE